MNYYLKKCHKHIQFTIRVQERSYENVIYSLFGGGTSSSSSTSSTTNTSGAYINENGKEVIDGYEVATAEDMEWLASIL